MKNTMSYENSETLMKRLLRPEEVASLLNVSRAYAYLLMQRGEIPTVKMGRSVRVRPQDLAAFVEQNLHTQR